MNVRICGMAVNATCGKCDEPLVDDVLKSEDGCRSSNFKMPKQSWKN